MHKTIIGILLSLLATSAAFTQEVEWPHHGNDPGGSKYSSLDQISLTNVNRLEKVWTWETGEEPIPMARVPMTDHPVTPGRFEGSAVMVRGTLYIPTSYNQVVAIDPDTGEELWRYDPRAYEWGRPFRGCGFCHRGVAVWTQGDEIRVFINSRWRLIALDGKTGLPIESFGNEGEVDLTKDLLEHTTTSVQNTFDEITRAGGGKFLKTLPFHDHDHPCGG